MAETKQRFASFRNQRVGWTFLVFLIVFCFTTAVLWGHCDRIIADSFYRGMFKVGLFLLPCVALLMTIWELFVDDVSARRIHKPHATVVRLVNWCFVGSIILAVCEIIHAGAILKLESSVVEQKETIGAVADAQAKIAAASTSAAIESSGKVAQEMNANGQRVSARRTITSGKDIASAANQTAQSKINEIAGQTKASTFLPDPYVNGGMYVALPLLALLFFGMTMTFARQAQPFIDRDDNGVPDSTEKENEFPKEIEVGK